MKSSKLSTALTYCLREDRVEVSNNTCILGHVGIDGSFDAELSDWCDGFPDDARAEFIEGIALDAVIVRSILPVNLKMGLSPIH